MCYNINNNNYYNNIIIIIVVSVIIIIIVVIFIATFENISKPICLYCIFYLLIYS